MSPGAATSIGDVVAQLAKLDLRAWHGLPAGLALRAADGDVAGVSMLGSAFEPADVVSLDTPPGAIGARAWLRGGAVVVVDVALDSERPDALVPDFLPAPARRLDVAYGLVHLPSGEWVYPTRGLALVVAHGRVRHAMGFTACSETEYEARLRVQFAMTRRPLEAGRAKEGL
jgi:hypothetical protein